MFFRIHSLSLAQSHDFGAKFGKGRIETRGFPKSCLLDSECLLWSKTRNNTLELPVTEMISLQHFLREHLYTVSVMNVLRDYTYKFTSINEGNGKPG